MAILRPSEIRKLNAADRQKRASELRLELAKERAKVAVGAAATSPGRLREIRRSLARLETVRTEEARKASTRPAAKPAPKLAPAKAAKPRGSQ